MNSTPRRGPGGFPATPQHPQQQQNRTPTTRSPNTASSTPSRPNVRSPLPDVPKSAAPPASSGPLIPYDILDAPQQRFYVFAFYVALQSWKIYDFYSLAIEEEQSVALCLKWCFLDMCLIFGVPLLEIPWLEWSNAAAFLLFILHAISDCMLMFRIGLPLTYWLVSLGSFLYDTETAINERSVKPGPILFNASLILGKQIINILPEGSAILNPDKTPFCLNASVTHLEIPILINQTDPIEMELVRIDVENNSNETIIIKKGELKNMMKKARKSAKSGKNTDPADPLMLRYTVKKKGIYLLSKVLDQSKLEVRPRASSAIVAACPKAWFPPTKTNLCRNDLSDVTIAIEGVPPLSVKYRLFVDGRARGGSEFQNLQSDLVSPLSRQSSQALVKSGREDVSWARSQKIEVPLNEALTTGKLWEYAVEHISDGLGNIVNFGDFVSLANTEEEDHPKSKPATIQQFLFVHERPTVFFKDCSPQRPLQVAKGDVTRLPVTFSPAWIPDQRIEYLFTPESDIVADGYHSPNAELQKQTLKTERDQPFISAAGLYTLKSVSTTFCTGEVLEPTSCLLQNPPEPELSLSSEDIVDQCAGRPTGLRVGLDFIGTPPFEIFYTEQKKGYGNPATRRLQVGSLRGSIDLTPDQAGHYTYKFVSISDAMYKQRPLRDLQLQQNVSPPALARFSEGSTPKQACIDDSVEFPVELIGEGPFKLEYEIVHNGKRKKFAVNVDEKHHTIKTGKLKSGGEYTVALVGITDKTECKTPLNGEAKVNARHERPKAYFGHIEGKQSVMALEGREVDLPLRLTGAKPWKLEYRNLKTQQSHEVDVPGANAILPVSEDGTYELVSVHDAVCPGVIDEKASQFNVGWIARPRISIPESQSMLLDGGKYIKDAICEGDEDSFDVSFTGHAPFDATYRQVYKDKKGKAAPSVKELRAVGSTTSIRTDTVKPGSYEYTFIKLADARYDHSPKHFSPVTVHQIVNPRPSARFNNPGKTYSFCSREAAADGEEVIPVTLEGVPPFHLEVEIKHAGTPTPEISTHKNIMSTKYDLKIEHRKLHLGHSSITIRKIRDARGCSFKPPPGGPRVQISVHDAPSATALEDRTDFCVGERLSFALGGQVPFTVYYTFNKDSRKASNAGTTFRRLAELPGTFTLTGLRDSASDCLAALELTKQIHPIPSVRLSGGQVSEVDIHEGGGTDLEFSFTGTPPFEFTYTRSTNAGRGKKSKVLEIRTEISQDFSMRIPVQEEGTYEVVSIKDRWCSFAKPIEGVDTRGSGQKLLQY